MKRLSLLLGMFVVPAVTHAQFFDFASSLAAESYHVTGVSSDGKTICGYNEGVATRAFRYQQGGAIQFLEPTGTRPFIDYSRAYAISGNGLVIAGDSSGTPGQTKWNTAGTPSVFDATNSGATILGLNVDGTIAVTSGTVASRIVNGVYTQLPTAGLTYPGFGAWGISSDGTKIVGTNFTTVGFPDRYKIALWKLGVGMTLLPNSDGHSSEAMSRDGSTIVSDNMVWDSSLTSSVLAGLPNIIGINATAVSSTGSYIGGTTRDGSSGLDLATLWDSQRNPILLKDFLLTKGINVNSYDLGSITALEETNGELSISGLYRVGQRNRPYMVHVVPEPASIVAVCLGGLALLRRRKVKAA